VAWDRVHIRNINNSQVFLRNKVISSLEVPSRKPLRSSYLGWVGSVEKSSASYRSRFGKILSTVKIDEKVLENVVNVTGARIRKGLIPDLSSRL